MYETLDMGGIWWEQMPGPSLFIKELADHLYQERSVLLLLPDEMPWPEVFHDTAVEHVFDLVMDRTVRLVEDDARLKPGAYLMEQFCEAEIQAGYRYGISHAEFLATAAGSHMNSLCIWITGISEERVDAWCDFVAEYVRSVPKGNQPAVFVLECRGGKQVFKGRKILAQMSYAHTVTRYDQYLFCAMATASVRGKSGMSAYLAELVASLCGEDLMLVESCVLSGKKLIEDPVEEFLRIQSDSKEYAFDGRTGLTVQDIEKRVRACQLRVLFPEVEAYRMDFVSRYHRQIGRLLPIRNSYGELVTTANEVELGTLFFLWKNGELPLDPAAGEHLELMKNVRNKLAHLVLVSYGEVERILS